MPDYRDQLVAQMLMQQRMAGGGAPPPPSGAMGFGGAAPPMSLPMPPASGGGGGSGININSWKPAPGANMLYGQAYGGPYKIGEGGKPQAVNMPAQRSLSDVMGSFASPEAQNNLWSAWTNLTGQQRPTQTPYTPYAGTGSIGAGPPMQQLAPGVAAQTTGSLAGGGVPFGGKSSGAAPPMPMVQGRI